jgi:hypothetical protein
VRRRPRRLGGRSRSPVRRRGSSWRWVVSRRWVVVWGRLRVAELLVILAGVRWLAGAGRPR